MSWNPDSDQMLALERALVAASHWSREVQNFIEALPPAAIRNSRLVETMVTLLLSGQDAVSTAILAFPTPDTAQPETRDETEGDEEQEEPLAAIIDFQDWRDRKHSPNDYFDRLLDRLHNTTEDTDHDDPH